MDDDNNLNDTINNDIRDNKNHIPGEDAIKREAKKEAKKLSRKARKKIAKTLFKQVGITLFTSFTSIIIIIFFLIGIITFVTTMPGLVQENLINKVSSVLKNLSNLGTQEYVTYLNDLASGDVESEGYKARTKVLMYLDDMGLDPVGFGFAAFYSRTSDESATYDATIELEEQYKDFNESDFFDFNAARKYYDELKEKVIKEDLIFKYLYSNERTYLVNDLESIKNLNILNDYNMSLTPMIDMLIEGIDDSKITIDRENKQLIISSLNNTGFLEWANQQAKYNMETWAGRYGMPLEFMLALHIATMSSDLTNEMMDNQYLDTKVQVSGAKGEYSIDYDIKYDGENLGIKRGAKNTEYELYNKYEDHLIKKNDDGSYSVSASAEEIQKMKNNGEITLNTLWGWINNLSTWSIKEDRNPDAFIALAGMAKDAITADDDSMFFAKYGFIDSQTLSTSTILNTSYLGTVKENSESPGTLSGELNEQHLKDKEHGYIGIAKEEEDEINSGRAEKYDVLEYEGDNFLYVPKAATEDSSTSDFSNLTGNGFEINTVNLHSLKYYADHPSEIKKEAIRKGITSVLSQIDAYLYRLDSQTGLLKSDDIVFTEVGINNSTMERESNGSIKTAQLLLTKEWLDFCDELDGKSDAQIKEKINELISHINQYYDIVSQKDAHVEEILKDMLEKLDLPNNIDVDTLGKIYEAVQNQNDTYEFVSPRIKYVIKHWYKDVIFEYKDGDVDVNVYSSKNKLELPVELDNDLDGKLKITANLTYKSGDKPATQNSQPYVVKGDVVTLDGEVVTDDAAKLANTQIISSYSNQSYTIGDGYRVSKRLFTQGQYYVFDGSAETSKSIYYAREMEKLTAGQWGRVTVSSGRISSFLNLENNIEKVKLDGTTKIELDSCDLYKITRKSTTLYYIYAKQDLNYVSTGSLEEGIIEKSKESVEKINGILNKMDVITIRKPISFDNTTENGDVTALTAFNILENMHSESAEYIYRDLKEFLIELGYYTKAEFEYINTDVLKWFIPDYIPEDKENWNQADEKDSLKYGAIIYQKKTENSEGEKEQTVRDGFEADLDIIAPGKAKILEKTDNKIKLEFDGIEQPEIGILDGYVMIISGSGIKITTEKQVGDSVDCEEVIGVTVTNENQDAMIQIVLKNNLNGYVSDINDYMKPREHYQASAEVGDYGYFYWIPYESADPGIVSGPTSNEVAVGISQWTALKGNYNNVSKACQWLYEKDPIMCAELKTFTSWSTDDVFRDYYGGQNQLKNAFREIEQRDHDGFLSLQMQLTQEERNAQIRQQGMDWILDRNPIVVGTYYSCLVLGPNYGWTSRIDNSMSDKEIIMALMKRAIEVRSDISGRLNSQARLASDLLDGTFTDLEGWISNKGLYSTYGEGNNPGYVK